MTSALYRKKVYTETVNYIYGLGGRDYTVEEAETIYSDLADLASGAKTPAQFQYLGLRK